MLLEIEQPRSRQLESILQVGPELHYRRFRSIQLHEHTHRALHGVALEYMVNVLFGSIQEALKLLQRRDRE
jgi:hypothetical protein